MLKTIKRVSVYIKCKKNCIHHYYDTLEEANYQRRALAKSNDNFIVYCLLNCIYD